MTCRSALILVIVASVVGGVSAQRAAPPTNESVGVYGVGASSCGVWLDAREKEKTNPSDVRHLQFESFIDGFASGLNWYRSDAPNSNDALKGTDAFAQRAYLDKFCRENPTKPFASAVADLLDFLRTHTP